ncbi:hypothetical protein PoB_002252500 [Plakobranchus ocellatus]|uniref:Uncharacterized protein n=1 Tax=Plakobranchus ocellatus TaxID=259542 RepID=A0AAV3ZK24_9GAST|nr:hypothetical protein PoB_002252500 [Plakobranchus ocellatus]
MGPARFHCATLLLRDRNLTAAIAKVYRGKGNIDWSLKWTLRQQTCRNKTVIRREGKNEGGGCMKTGFGEGVE